MAHKGSWGDKIIIVLSGNDEPRDRRWCEHYRKSDKHCCEQNLKCMGSSQCRYYKKKSGIGPIEPKYIPADVEQITLPSEENVVVHKSFSTHIPGRHPSFGEKMMGKVVMTKGKYARIHIGEVIAEDHDTFTVERDSGEIRKYMRKDTLRAKSVWVIEDYEV